MKLHINESAAYNLDNAESRRKEISDRFGGDFTPDDHILICKDNKKLNIQVGKKYKCTATNGQQVEIVSIDKLFPEDTGNSALITAYYRGKMICIASNQLYESVNKKMRKHFRESVSNIPMMPKFGILNDTITVSKGRYPDNTYKNIQIPENKLFRNFAEFCTEVSNYVDYELPYNPRNFESIEFERISSRLTLSWYNDDNTFCQLFCCLYAAPSPLTEYDLDKFEIPLKG